jgi:hypothetical protein
MPMVTMVIHEPKEKLWNLCQNYVDCAWLGTAVTASERQQQKEFMYHFVVDEGDKPLPIIVFSNIKPTHPLNFLLHVALSLGEFSNALELFGDSTDICNIFHAGKLYDPIDPVTSTKNTICRYVLEQLVHLPSGTKMFDRLCISAYSVIYEALVGGNILLQETPPVLYTSLRIVTSDMLQEKLLNKRVNLVVVTLRDLKWDGAHRDLPDEQIMAGSMKHKPLYPPNHIH